MSTPLFVENSIIILSPAARVWDILTNPSETKKYMFGCETISDWKPGSDLLWRGQYEGKDMVFVKGKIIKINPGHLLTYTTIDPNSGINDSDENYLTVTYSLHENDGHTTLTISQGDYAKVGDGDKRYRETIDGGGWTPILEQVKQIAEQDPDHG